MRVRFAPSPTGALHIGGVRTALYNYLLAKQQNGVFILRIEDTDQARYVEGAESYIKEALAWCGLMPDEGPDIGGEFGPYRQSERKDIYQKYTKQLLAQGSLYYAFDTAEELDQKRKSLQDQKIVFKYDAQTRMQMRNSLSLSPEQSKSLLEAGVPYTLRLKVDPGHQVKIHDVVRGEVVFSSAELDDKVMMKADGLPTYHLANIVDDHLMEISHVIRGEEWLPSTAHHLLLYEAFGWSPPQFAHLPLILKPTGKGKLSKRDGSKLGIPVFPLSWEGPTEEDSFTGFRAFGFDPKAVVNFLAFLGWNPGSEQELFSMEGLINAFSLDKIGKSGARFDYEKALWFNQQYILQDESLDAKASQVLKEAGQDVDRDAVKTFTELYRARIQRYPEFWEQGYYCFEDIKAYDSKNLRKKWKSENAAKFEDLYQLLLNTDDYSSSQIESMIKTFIEAKSLSFGAVLPILRIAMTGHMKGPDIFQTISFLGRDRSAHRLRYLLDHIESLSEATNS